jgi:hypothetical protein
MKKSKLKRRVAELEEQVGHLRDMNSRLRNMRELDACRHKHDNDAHATHRRRLHETIAFLALNFHAEVKERSARESNDDLDAKLAPLAHRGEAY